MKRGPRALQRLASLGFVAVFVAFAIAVPIIFLIGNHQNSSKKIGSVTLTSFQKGGRELFHEHCAVCHSLAASAAQGQVGPNLDMIKPSYGLVMHTLQNGCLPNVPTNSPQYCLGYGVMPANVLQGKDARQVAEFVSAVAGRE